jgi:hypothetical protein
VTGARPAPWSGRDLFAVVALNAAGLALIVAGSVWASGRTVVADQFPATDLTVLGLVLAGAGNLTWLLAGRRTLARVRRLLLEPWADRS